MFGLSIRFIQINLNWMNFKWNSIFWESQDWQLTKFASINSIRRRFQFE